VIIDGAAGGETKRHHDVARYFSSVDVAPWKRSCTFFYKKRTLSMPVSCRFFIPITEEILRTLLLMHDGISFGKILPKQVLFWGMN
jgi:hypothetical protein